MAYASKYYDPQKAHQYYMQNRELKGYENRYGGARGNGTSAASDPSLKPADEYEKKNQENKIHNLNIQDRISKLKSTITSNTTSTAKDVINDEVQKLRMQTKGGSTSGFNQKGKEAAAYIKSEMEKERDEIIKKSNKEVDDKMLSDVKRLSDDISAMRASGRGFSNKQLAARIRGMLGEAKKTKIAAKKKHTKAYKQKYKDEIDKLRGDETMYTYYDKKQEKLKKQAEKEAAKNGKRTSSGSKSTSGGITGTLGSSSNGITGTLGSSSKSSSSSNSITGTLRKSSSSSSNKKSNGYDGSSKLSWISDEYLESARDQAKLDSDTWTKTYNSMSKAQQNSQEGKYLKEDIDNSNKQIDTLNKRLSYLGGSVKQKKQKLKTPNPNGNVG